MPTLLEQLDDYVNAAFAGLWIQTHEPDEAEREIARHGRDRDWTVASWDAAHGLRVEGQLVTDNASDPLAALRALPAMAKPNGGATLLLLHQFHRFLQSPEIIQTLFAAVSSGKQRRTFVVVLSPVIQLPPELEKLFIVLDHPLPSRQQLEEIARELLSNDREAMPQGEDLDRVLEAAAGLTRYEAEGAFSLSIVRHHRIAPKPLWELKAQTLRKSNVLQLHRGNERFDALGGLGNLKAFCRKALAGGKPVRPRGILLLGVPGSGKSAFCKALGNETGRPTLILDFGALLGSLVGQSEANLRQALRIAEAMSPAILMVDELEKALGGVGSAGDSGVATRMFGTLLTWLSDHESDIFFVGTSNDISKLPPEFARAERFDGVFFLDLPDAEERNAIWDLYRRSFEIPDSEVRPDDASWTGAEIRACCRLAALLGVPLTDAAHHVVPVAVTAAEQVDRLRTWATGRCLSSSAPGIFGQEHSPSARPRRSLARNPSSRN
ncbi:MAG: AAA family ATPase [Gemmataceae bacterium]